MLTVTGLWFDHERTPVGLDHTPVFGWQLEGNCRNIRQTQYRLQVALTPDFAALLYDETCETGNSTAVHAAGLTLQSLQKYYARVQVWADTAAGPQQTLWSEPAVFITALLDPAAEWKAEFVSAESPETCRESSAGTMVRAAFTVKPGLRAAYACTTALGLYNVYLNGQKVSTDEMTPGWTSYNRRLLYQTYEVTDMLHPGLNMAGAMLGAGWYKGVMGLTRSRNNYGDTTAFAMAGFTYCYDSMNFYLLGKTCAEDGTPVLELLKSDTGVVEDVCDPVPVPDGTLDFKLTTTPDGGMAQFYYRQPQGEWQSIGPACPTDILTDEHCRGFTGAHVGVYAHDMAGLHNHADFDYLNVHFER